MATVKRRYDPSLAAPDGRVPLAWLLAAAALDRSAWTPAQRATWLALQSEIGAACVGGPFDPRRVLTLRPGQLAAWTARRAAWIRAQFRHDPRVTTEATWPR